MQQSGHIGNLVVRPQTDGIPCGAASRFQVRAEGTHIITGAFGGFGLETAKWLVDNGARHLVLGRRRGASVADAQAVVEGFCRARRQGGRRPCDVTIRAQFEQLFEGIHAHHAAGRRRHACGDGAG